MYKKTQTCKDCSEFKRCQDSAVSWLFLFIGLIATIAVRLVNLVIDFKPIWAKLFWYIGIAGFFIYFLYKFRQDHAVHKELEKNRLSGKLSRREALSDQDYEFLSATVCRLKSTKDAVNYFFIFFSSAIALVLAIVQDFFR
jgi:hypothetical protein